jgi:hypothetical protein
MLYVCKNEMHGIEHIRQRFAFIVLVNNINGIEMIAGDDLYIAFKNLQPPFVEEVDGTRKAYHTLAVLKSVIKLFKAVIDWSKFIFSPGLFSW